LRIKGINRLKLIELKQEIELILEITEPIRDISNADDVEIVRTLYIEKGNINEIIEALNASGFKVPSQRGSRKYISSDIAEILNQKDESLASMIANWFYMFNKGRCGWKALIRKCDGIRK